MDIENLETFIEVAETRSFSQSARILSLTQPAVSKRIAALESELSTKLFDRTGRTVHLTEAGHILLPSAKQIRSELYRIEDVISDIGKSIRGKLAIGTTEFVVTRQLLPVLTSFRQTFADVFMDIRIDTTEALIERVENNYLDLAFCPLHQDTGNKLAPRLQCTEVWSADLKVVVGNSDPLALCSDVSMEQLRNTPAILPSSETLARKAIDEQLRGKALEANMSLEVNNFTTARAMCAAGLGWSCLPESEIDDTLTILDVDALEFPHSIALIHRHDATLSRAATVLLDFLPLENHRAAVAGLDNSSG